MFAGVVVLHHTETLQNTGPQAPAVVASPHPFVQVLLDTVGSSTERWSNVFFHDSPHSFHGVSINSGERILEEFAVVDGSMVVVVSFQIWDSVVGPPAIGVNRGTGSDVFLDER